ncbi:hypothetical protein EYF80_020618 [Liparis tanakae]|uniref:Uncharacterized protein n=1 Tax=Liparis tanakae TaxID=230148 RepID=A0A4Z2HUC9_9TELE|nr:hypothetical protein EYF80_020618 [Liparis tanakae]
MQWLMSVRSHPAGRLSGALNAQKKDDLEKRKTWSENWTSGLLWGVPDCTGTSRTNISDAHYMGTSDVLGGPSHPLLTPPPSWAAPHPPAILYRSCVKVKEDVARALKLFTGSGSIDVDGQEVQAVRFCGSQLATSNHLPASGEALHKLENKICHHFLRRTCATTDEKASQPCPGTTLI